MLIDMMPSRYIAYGDKTKEGYFSFKEANNDHGAVVDISVTPKGERVFKMLPMLVSIIADQGNDLIIDEVLLGNELLRLYIEKLTAHTIYFIGVFCELNSMQEREILRADRAIGLSNGQERLVHAGVREYDLKVDTTNTSPFKAAKQILTFISENHTPKGFKKMHEGLLI